MTESSMTGQPSKSDGMSIERLRRIIDVYGAASRRWPEDERAAARALILRSKDAEAILRAAEPVDHMLAGLAPPPPSDVLAARVMGLAPVPPSRPGRLSGRTQAILRYVLAPLAIGGAGAALVALSLWLVFAGTGAPDPVSVTSGAEIAADDGGQGLLQGIAVVDVAAGDLSGVVSDADLGLDTAVAPPGDGLVQLSAGDVTGIPLD